MKSEGFKVLKAINILIVMACILPSCSAKQAVQPTPAEVIDYVRDEIASIDDLRSYRDVAAQKEHEITAYMLRREEVSECAIRLILDHGYMGHATADDPYFCMAILATSSDMTKAEVVSLLKGAFEHAELKLSTVRWPGSFGDTVNSPPIDLLQDGRVFSLDWAWAFPSDAEFYSNDEIFFQPVDSQAQDS